jgi:hypothetical protein
MHDQDRRHRDDESAQSRSAVALRWLALVDSCRPASEDAFQPVHAELAPLAEQLVADPAVQELYERTQQADAAIRDAILDVPVPAGLAERLLAAVSSDAAEEGVVSLPRRDEAASRGRFWRRRSVLAAAAAVVAAMVVGPAVYFIGAWQSRPLSVSEVIEQSQQWVKDVADNPLHRGVDGAPHDDFPADPQLKLGGMGWRRFETQFGEAVVYDVRSPFSADKRQALLFVVRTRRTGGLPTSPPVAAPQRRTQGSVTGVWSRPADNLLYVLVVDGPLERYQSFVRSRRLAMLGSAPSSL